MSSSSRAAKLRKAVASAVAPRPRQIRPVVILGAGGIVRSAHLPAYRKAGFPVLALADCDSGKAAALAVEYSIPHAFDSVSAALRFAPHDAVFDIAVPAAQLLTVLPLLPRGSTVLMQKPMGETLEEAQHIRDLCRERNLMAAVNFQLRYSPAHLGAMALAHAGVLGTLHDIEVQVRAYTPWHLWSFLASAPRLEILYHSIHYVDLMRDWLGLPAGIYAKTVRHPACSHLAATKSAMILDYGDTARVLIATNHGHDLAPSSQLSFIQLEGTNGAIRIGMGVNLDYPQGKPDTLSYIEHGDAEWTKVPLRGNWFPDAFLGSMEALQAFAEDPQGELPIGFEQAFITMAMVEAAYRSSARGGEPLPL